MLDFSIRSRSQHHGEEGILEEEEEKEVLLDRCEVTRREWSTHWQCDEDVQNMQDIHWRNEELRRCEKALPRLLEGDLERASRVYKSKTGVGWDGFHPESSLWT